MILYQWRGPSSNFGDELNSLLWPRLLPGFFDDDPAVRFLGIGSVLDCRHPRHALKLVAGAGYGGYEARPVLDDSWVVHWVRGPRTAATLGLPDGLGLGDPAMLLPHALNLPAPRDGGIGFMPHFESLGRGAWQTVAALAGVTLIDPRLPPLDVLAAIGRCRLLLSEAMHGIIAADALRVPWIAIRPLAPVHRAKWQDWAEAAQVAPCFAPLPASSVAEWVVTGSPFARRLSRRRLDRMERGLAGVRSERLVARAAEALGRATGMAPQLSPDSALDRCQSRMLDAVARLRRQPCGSAAAHGCSHLQAAADSAYQPTLIG